MEEYWINFSLLGVLVLINFGSIVFFYYFFGEVGLLMFVPLAIIIANIQVLKLVDLFALTTALGNIAYGGTFLVSDVLVENYGKKKARLSIFIGMFSLIFFTSVLYITTLFVPSIHDTSHEHMYKLFNFIPRIVFAGIVTYYFVQNFDVLLYGFIKRVFPKYLFIRNNLSTIVSQLLDTLIFSFIAFGFHFKIGSWKIEQAYSWDVIFEIMMVAYLFKLVTAILDTPFIYILKWMKQNNVLYHSFKKQ